MPNIWYIIKKIVLRKRIPEISLLYSYRPLCKILQHISPFKAKDINPFFIAQYSIGGTHSPKNLQVSNPITRNWLSFNPLLIIKNNKKTSHEGRNSMSFLMNEYRNEELCADCGGKCCYVTAPLTTCLPKDCMKIKRGLRWRSPRGIWCWSTVWNNPPPCLWVLKWKGMYNPMGKTAPNL